MPYRCEGQNLNIWMNMLCIMVSLCKRFKDATCLCNVQQDNSTMQKNIFSEIPLIFFQTLNPNLLIFLVTLKLTLYF